MGLISKIKEGLQHNHEETPVVADGQAVVAEQKVAVAKADVVVEDKVVDVPINTNVAEVEKTVVEAPTEVQVKQADAVLQEKKSMHEEVEINPVVDRVVDETEVRQTILPVKDEVNEASSEERVMATDKRNITEAPTDDVKAKYKEQSQAVQSSYTEVEGEQTVHVNAPVIEEVHKKHIVEEIQPVIERTTHHTHKIHTTQPIEEHIVAAAKVADIQVKAPISMEEFKKTQMSSHTAMATNLSGNAKATTETVKAEKEVDAVAAVPVVPVVAAQAVEIREE